MKSGIGGVGFSSASKSCPDASVEIALTFSLRNTRDIPSRSNSKRLASRAELKFKFKSAISEFRIVLSRSCTSLLCRGLLVLWFLSSPVRFLLFSISAIFVGIPRGQPLRRREQLHTKRNKQYRLTVNWQASIYFPYPSMLHQWGWRLQRYEHGQAFPPPPKKNTLTLQATC